MLPPSSQRLSRAKLHVFEHRHPLARTVCKRLAKGGGAGALARTRRTVPLPTHHVDGGGTARPHRTGEKWRVKKAPPVVSPREVPLADEVSTASPLGVSTAMAAPNLPSPFTMPRPPPFKRDVVTLNNGALAYCDRRTVSNGHVAATLESSEGSSAGVKRKEYTAPRAVPPMAVTPRPGAPTSRSFPPLSHRGCHATAVPNSLRPTCSPRAGISFAT